MDIVIRLKCVVETMIRRNVELEQTNSQHENDKARLNNEIISLRMEVQQKDATINELRQKIVSVEPGIQPFVGPRQQEDVGGIAIVPPQIVNAVQGAVRNRRGSVSNLEDGNRPPRTKGCMKLIPKKRRGPQGSSVQATTRPDNHQQRDEAVPRITQQPTRSVLEERMELLSQNFASDAEADRSRGEKSGNLPQHEVVSQSHPYYRKCVCGKCCKTYKALHAHIRLCKN